MTEALHILHVARGLPNSSGATHVVRPLAEEQARQGANVSVWLCEQGGEMPNLPDRNLVRSRVFPTSLPFYHPGISLPFARALSKAVGEFDFIHIHGVWSFPTWWAMRSAVRAGVPFMVAPHGSFEPWAMRRHGGRKAVYARYVEVPLINRAWSVQALSPAEVDQVKALGVTAPAKIVPNGVDPSWFACAPLDLSARFGIPPGARTLLSLSRLDPKKGIDILIRGFASFSQDVGDVHLMIAGQDYQSGYGNVLKNLVAAHGLDQRVHFIGEIRDLEKYRLLRSADAFALVSHSEGLPLGVLEAMAAGLPAIITPGCNIQEAEASGAAVMVKVEVADVTRGLQTVFCRDGAMADMGRAGQRLISERFTWRSIATQTLSLYRESRSVANVAATNGPVRAVNALSCNGSWPDDEPTGPVQSLLGLADALSAEFNFKVIARERDVPLRRANGVTQAWQRYQSIERHSCSTAFWGQAGLARLLRSTPHDILLLNGFFDRELTLPALALRRLGLIPRRPTILAPRGEFSAGALALKGRRKQLYLKAVRKLGLLDGVWLHAIGDYEAEDIRAACPWASRIVVAPNIRVLLPLPAPAQSDTANCGLRLVFLSRIDRKKNLDYALRVLAKVSAPIVFDIYGPVSDTAYWNECRRMMANLPAHVEANYRGTIPNQVVCATLAGYDLFFLPTRGENFGHAIFDALEAGVPVLISDQTPWRQLGSSGYSLPLSDPGVFAAVIEQLARLSPLARSPMRQAARAAAEDYAKMNADAVTRNRAMLLAVLQQDELQRAVA